MRWIWTFAAFLAALSCVAACTSSSGGTPTQTLTPPHTTAAPLSTEPQTPTSTDVGPPHPTRPSVPADVPRTGPNTKAGEKPPLMPLEATQHTPDGAKAFAAFFIKTIDWGYATTSSTYMRHYFTNACLTCRSFADAFDSALRKHQHYIGGRISVGSDYVRSQPTGAYVVAVPFTISAFERIDSRGHVAAADGAHGHERFDVTTVWDRGEWHTTKMALET